MFNAMKGEDGKSIFKAITQYAEITTSAESNMSDMESELSHIKVALQNSHVA